MLDIISTALVLAGVAAMGRSVVLNGRLVSTLGKGRIRRQWQVMMALEGLFIAGYLLYLEVPVEADIGVLEIAVPIVFFLGGVFVLLTTRLTSRTAADAGRIALLEQQAITDPLTNLFNRRHLDRRVEEEVARAHRDGLPLSVLVIDLDHFKRVNDRFGHQVGDLVLVRLACLLLKTVRQNDFVARFGGEEFVIVAPNSDLDASWLLAERVRSAVSEHDFTLPIMIDNPGKLAVTVSIGVACLRENRSTAKAVLNAADESLYRAKRLGRNRVSTNEPGRYHQGLGVSPARANAA